MEPESDGNIPDHFAAALKDLIAEIREAEGNRILLKAGRRTGTWGNTTLYRFMLAEDVQPSANSRLEAMFGDRRERGEFVSAEAGYLTVALRSDAGEELPEATLAVDSTDLLEALHKQVTAAGRGELPLNRELADATVKAGGVGRKGIRPIPAATGTGLSPAQRSAYEHALNEPLTFIWGPPGCGKTLTLGEIVLSALRDGKRTLVCSNTNRAVDQVLWRICEGLAPEYREVEDGKVLRLGKIDDDKLRQKYSSRITRDGIVDRKSKDLRKIRRSIELEIEEIKLLDFTASKYLEGFDILKKIKSNLDKIKHRIQSVSADILSCSNEIVRNLSKREKLNDEFRRSRKSKFGIFVRREHLVWIDIRNNKKRHHSLHDRLGTLQEECRFLHQSLNDLTERRARLENFLADRSVMQERKSKESYDRKLKKLAASIIEIDKKIEGLRQTVTKEAEIVGTTCTTAYLSWKNLYPFDLVLIDEASMVLLPAVWLSAGLSRERVVISGDFRQIPSIVESDNRTVIETLGRDPFTATGRTAADSPELVMLDTQYRMHPAISALVAGPMYDGRLFTGRSPDPVSDRALPVPFETPLTIIDTSQLRPFEGTDAKRPRYNLLHAILVERLVSLLRREGVVASEHDLGIVTPYAAQAKLIAALTGTGDGVGPAVQVGTVHKFQGDERRVMMFEIPESIGGRPGLGVFVRGDPPSHTGARLINVAITRAQDHLIIIANLEYLDTRLPSNALLRAILHDMRNRGRIVPGRVLLESDAAGDGDRRPQGAAGRVDVFDASGYESAILHDILASERSVKFHSRFPLPDRIARLADLLRSKLSAGVEFECTVRYREGDAPSSGMTAFEAVSMLGNIGVSAGFDDRIDQSACLIDDRILWIGASDLLGRGDASGTVVSRVSDPAVIPLLSPFIPADGERGRGPHGGKGPRCPDCGAPANIRWGGKDRYPECGLRCDWQAEITRAETRARRADGPKVGGKNGPEPNEGYPACPRCGAPTRPRNGRYGPFLGCSRYPACRGTLNPERWNSGELPGETVPS